MRARDLAQSRRMPSLRGSVATGKFDSARRDLGRIVSRRAFSHHWPRNSRLQGKRGELLRRCRLSLQTMYESVRPRSQVLSAEQSNSSMLFENKFFLKLYRKLEDGVNPDVEITRFLTERRSFQMCRRFSARSNIAGRKSEPTVVCLLQSAVHERRRCLGAHARCRRPLLRARPRTQSGFAESDDAAWPAARGIDRRHLSARKRSCLASARANCISRSRRTRTIPPLRRSRSTRMAQRSVYQNMRASLRRAFALLQKKLAELPEAFRERSRRSPGRGERNSRAGTAHSRSAFRRDQDPHPRRLSSRARLSIPEKISSFSISKANRRVR